METVAYAMMIMYWLLASVPNVIFLAVIALQLQLLAMCAHAAPVSMAFITMLEVVIPAQSQTAQFAQAIRVLTV